MSNLTVIRVNQTVYSWTSTQTRIDNQPTQDIVAIDYENTRERKKVWGQRQDGKPIGKTGGKYDPKIVTLKILRDAAYLLKVYLSGKGKGSYGDAFFNLQLSVSEPSAPELPPLMLLATGCTIVGEKLANEEGIDELVTEFTLDIMTLTENGLQLWSAVAGLGGLP